MKGVSAKNTKISLGDQSLYPFLKITNEKFPRLLVTRKIETDDAEYFGAFLPETGVRFFINFLNTLFKLRTCTIEIDGDFKVPCPQFYAKRCLAPCVRNLCDEKEYLESVELLRLFLGRKNDEFTVRLLEKIEKFAEDLDFETASIWRDKLQTIEDFWQKNEWILWLDDAKDSWEIERKNGETFLFLVTMRGRKNLGRCVFVFENSARISDAEIYEQILPEFYRFHAPREVRVSEDFSNRKSLQNLLEKRENHEVKIYVANENNRKITAIRAIDRNKHEFDLQNIKPTVSTRELQTEIKEIFNLKRLPKRIEVFDVAHISGTNSVGACVVWENGRFLPDEYKFRLLGETSELKTLEKTIDSRFLKKSKLPDLILIDGGNSQLNATLKVLSDFEKKEFFVISAVKPPGKHDSLSHFLTEKGEKIDFKKDSEALNFLQTLRDEAHNAANEIHRIRRDFSHFYELSAVLPNLEEKTRREVLRKFGSIGQLKNASIEELSKNFEAKTAEIIFKDLENYQKNGEKKIEPPIVPVRYDDPNGDAQDLQPLRKL